MKWWGIGVFLAVVAAAMAWTTLVRTRETKPRKQQQLNAQIQSVLLNYKQSLKPGATRKAVEDYLAARNSVSLSAAVTRGQLPRP